MEFWRLWRCARRSKSDLLLTHTRFFVSSLLGYLHSRLWGCAWVHIEHGSWYVTVSSRTTILAARIYDETLGKLVLRRSRKNIAISKAVQKFIRRFDTRSSTLIYRGLEFAAMDATPPYLPDTVPASGKIIVSTACRLVKWKGVENAIKAINALPENIRNQMAYIIVGDGKDFEKLQAIAKPPIYLVGRMSHTQVIGILKESDIYIHPSNMGGGLSTSLIEAMYCQCGIIATPHEGADEAVIPNVSGLIIEDNSPVVIASSLIKLVNDKEKRERMARQAKASVIKQFSWPQNAERLSKILSETIAAYDNRIN